MLAVRLHGDQPSKRGWWRGRGVSAAAVQEASSAGVGCPDEQKEGLVDLTTDALSLALHCHCTLAASTRRRSPLSAPPLHARAQLLRAERAHLVDEADAHVVPQVARLEAKVAELRLEVADGRDRKRELARHARRHLAHAVQKVVGALGVALPVEVEEDDDHRELLRKVALLCGRSELPAAARQSQTIEAENKLDAALLIAMSTAMGTNANERKESTSGKTSIAKQLCSASVVLSDTSSSDRGSNKGRKGTIPTKTDSQSQHRKQTYGSV
eukprot:6206226-Pleurochrysis_carterae.AAC.2